MTGKWENVINAAQAEAVRQNLELTVVSHSERPDKHFILMALEEKVPPTLGIHVEERIRTTDKFG
jgi:hypothetical protein